MEVIEFSQFSGINTIYSLLAMLVVYFFTEIFKWYRKKQISNVSKENILISIKRLELLNMMQHSPEEKNTIMTLFTEYKKLGGNCYLDSKYQKWLKEN